MLESVDARIWWPFVHPQFLLYRVSLTRQGIHCKIRIPRMMQLMMRVAGMRVTVLRLGIHISAALASPLVSVFRLTRIPSRDPVILFSLCSEGQMPRSETLNSFPDTRPVKLGYKYSSLGLRSRSRASRISTRVAVSRCTGIPVTDTEAKSHAERPSAECLADAAAAPSCADSGLNARPFPPLQEHHRPTLR